MNRHYFCRDWMDAMAVFFLARGSRDQIDLWIRKRKIFLIKISYFLFKIPWLRLFLIILKAYPIFSQKRLLVRRVILNLHQSWFLEIIIYFFSHFIITAIRTIWNPPWILFTCHVWSSALSGIIFITEIIQLLFGISIRRNPKHIFSLLLIRIKVIGWVSHFF